MTPGPFPGVKQVESSSTSKSARPKLGKHPPRPCIITGIGGPRRGRHPLGTASGNFGAGVRNIFSLDRE